MKEAQEAYEKAHTEREKIEMDLAEVQSSSSKRSREEKTRRDFVQSCEAKVKKAEEEYKELERKKIKAERYVIFKNIIAHTGTGSSTISWIRPG